MTRTGSGISLFHQNVIMFLNSWQISTKFVWRIECHSTPFGCISINLHFIRTPPLHNSRTKTPLLIPWKGSPTMIFRTEFLINLSIGHEPSIVSRQPDELRGSDCEVEEYLAKNMHFLKSGKRLSFIFSMYTNYEAHFPHTCVKRKDIIWRLFLQLVLDHQRHPLGLFL